jgi:hypothetical protein
MRDTAFYRMPLWLYNRSMGRFLNKSSIAEESESDDEDIEAEDETQAAAPNDNGKIIRTKSTHGR